MAYKGYEIEVVDLPGTYSLTAYSLEEIVARDFIITERPDLVVDIVDASSLDRHLYLAVQLKELGVPLIIALNMVDLAETRGIVVDPKKLSAHLGAPVVPMVARSNRGIEDLLDTVIRVARDKPQWKLAPISYGMDIDRALDEISRLIEESRIFDKKYPSRWRALKCLEGDSQILGHLHGDPDFGPRIEAICHDIHKHTLSTLEEEPEAIIADHRYGYITGITKKAVKRRIESRLNSSDKLDKILTNRFLGPLIMVAILYGMYAFTFWATCRPSMPGIPKSVITRSNGRPPSMASRNRRTPSSPWGAITTVCPSPVSMLSRSCCTWRPAGKSGSGPAGSTTAAAIVACGKTRLTTAAGAVGSSGTSETIFSLAKNGGFR